MNSPAYTEEELTFVVSGEEVKALVRTPRRLCDRPAFLINLGADRHSALDGELFDIVPNIFLAAGHRVSSLDLPRHGDRAVPGSEGLVAIAQDIARGVDVFGTFQAEGRAFIDLCLARGLADQKRIVLNGTSRGGLAALHVMAGDPRVLACAIHAPVTYLPALTEYSQLEGHPVIERSNATALVERLADRAVFIAIGTGDPRVSAQRCFDFYARLVAASRRNPPVLFCSEGESHGYTYFSDAGYQAAAGFLLEHCAAQMKGPVEGASGC